MNRYLHIIILGLFIVAAVGLRVFGAQDLPNVLAFELSALDGADKDMVIEATQAAKFYLRDTGRADVFSFDPSSPLVKRATSEGRLKPEDLVGVSRLEDRVRIARALDASHVLSGEISYKQKKVTIKLTLAEVGSKNKWQKEGSAAASGPGVDANKRNISNALQSAASSAVSMLASEALKGVVPITNPQLGPTPQPEPEGLVQDSVSYARQGDELMATGDTAGAISAYRRAVNAEPKNIDYRIRLAKAYSKRGMTEQAADELKRAQQINPANEDVRIALARLYEDSGSPDKAAEVYEKQTEQDPENVDSRLNAGDLYWRQQKLDEAEQQYLSAVQIDPYDARPKERLLLLFTARGMFGESKKQVEQLQKLYANAGDPALQERYEKLKPIIDLQLRTLSEKIKENNDKFRTRKITREDLYDIIKGISLRLDSMSRFLEVLIVPADRKAGLQRRILAANLLSQAGYSLISYLETNKPEAKADVEMFLTEAANQMKESAPVKRGLGTQD